MMKVYELFLTLPLILAVVRKGLELQAASAWGYVVKPAGQHRLDRGGYSVSEIIQTSRARILPSAYYPRIRPSRKGMAS